MCIIENNALTASEIAKLSEIPQGRVYDVLDSLSKKGFCYVIAGSKKRYQAVNPEIAFKGYIEKKQEEVQSTIALKEQFKTFYDQNKSTNNPIDYFQLLTSKQSQIEKFDHLINISSTKLYSFNKKPYATGFNRSKDQIINASAPLRATLERGTCVRAIFEEEDEDNWESFKVMIDYYHSLGEEVRIIKQLPMKMLLADNSTAMISLQTRSEQKFNVTSMVVEHTDLTQGLMDLFEFYWQQATPYEEYSR